KWDEKHARIPLDPPTDGFPAPQSRSGTGFPKISRRLGTEHFEKRDLESESFLNIATQIVAQFFQSLNPSQDFCGIKSLGQGRDFLFRCWKITPPNIAARA